MPRVEAQTKQEERSMPRNMNDIAVDAGRHESQSST